MHSILERIDERNIAHFANYASQIKNTLDLMPWLAVSRVAEEILAAWSAGRTVYIFGNGGSASTAQHMAADLSKNTSIAGVESRRMRAVCLNDNIALITALANDNGYARIFADQLINYANPFDVAIAISGSGNSANVLAAIEVAKKLGLTTIGITGHDGGQLARCADISAVVPSWNIEQIEDIHVIIEHSITAYVRQSIHMRDERARN